MSHDTQNPSRWVTVRSRNLSLWQSAAVRMLMTDPPDGSVRCRSRAEALRHPVMAGVNRQVKIRAAGAVMPPPDSGPAATVSDPNLHAYVSQLHFEMAEAKRTKDQARFDRAAYACRQYATCDTAAWAGCETTYLEYMASTGGTLQYNDWTVQGKNNINYGVIDWTLPNDAAVAILGDWGTGLADAKALVEELMMLPKPPSAILHLGDIYYSGTPDECTASFADVLAAAAPGVPVFTIPGNHDYYDWGVGFYQMLPQLNAANSQQLQQASYFCLRTTDGMWQFLAADTGQGDTDPADEVSPLGPVGPSLRPTEIQWHQNKLSNFNGSTLLMTHHQFFSAAATINNDSVSAASNYPPYLNMYLGNVFAPYFQQIAAWFWGHEHSFYVFDNGLFGLNMGRLVGSSAYEEATSDDPYTVAFPQVPFNPTVELPAADGYYPHVCAVIDLERSAPADPISITYYQTPAWYESPPSKLPGLTAVLTETINPATP
jgi:3',5'-cyclic AMP phosphodiesterase CpdA